MEGAKKLSLAKVGTGWRVAFNRAAVVVCTLLGGAWGCAGGPPPHPPQCAGLHSRHLSSQEAHRVLQAPAGGQSRGESYSPQRCPGCLL